MILGKQIHPLSLLGVIIFLPLIQLEKTGPVYDTGDWIPIAPENQDKTAHREAKSSDRILNIDVSGEKFYSDAKFAHRKPSFAEHRPRKNPHIKRSPNQRQRPKIEQPYRFESVLSPPPKHHQLKSFPQKPSHQQAYNIQPQYHLHPRNPVQNSGQQIYQPVPIPPNHALYNLNVPQFTQNFQKYSTLPLEVQYQPNILPQISTANNTYFTNPSAAVVNSEIFESVPKPNIAPGSPIPSGDKDTVQLLYVPLEQLQKQNVHSGILDDAFKSLQQQKLISHTQETDPEETKPVALPLVSQSQPATFVNSQKYLEQVPLQEAPKSQETENFELISKNRGELILQNNQKTVRIPNKQQFQVQSEKQELVEITSERPIADAQPQQSYIVQQERQRIRENQVRNTPIQQVRNPYYSRDSYIQQPYLVQQQVKTPLTVQQPQLQQSYVVQNEPQPPKEQQYFVQGNTQNTRLQSIQRDILQQSLEVEKLQKQLQQGKAIEFQAKPTVPTTTKKRKPHQPPLSVYMEGNNQGDIEAVLGLLKNAKSIAVQDQIGPNTPQVFIGPSTLKTPDGFAKFPLPYLSNLDNNRIQRKAQQLPFFVAPLNYREPDGYSKIPLPSPHVGSVVVSRLNSLQNQNTLDSFQEPNRPVPIANYRFVNPAFESVLENNSNFDNNLNAYSLESSAPVSNPNRQLKEQALFQQINGFSGFEYPQNQYFQELSPQPVLGTPDQSSEELQPAQVKSIPSRQRGRGDSVRGTTVASSVTKESGTSGDSKRTKPKRIQTETKYEEVTTEITQKPERVEVSSQRPLTEEYLNRFSANNNFNYNFVSSTPNYGVSSPTPIEEIPANVRKLKIRPTQEVPDQINQQAINDGRFEQVLSELENPRLRPGINQERRRPQPVNEFEIPEELSNINPHLPGLINELQDQTNPTTLRFETSPVFTTRAPVTTTEAITYRTEAPTTTTTRKPRGRGRSRFNLKTSTTTSTPSRRFPSERRRPAKTTTESHTENSYRVNSYITTESERIRPRQRQQDILTERFAEASIESTPSPQQRYQPITRVTEITQNQPNYYVQYQSSISNEKPVQYEPEPQTEGAVRVVEQYQSQKVTPAEELAKQLGDQAPVRQFSSIQADRSESIRTPATQQPSETEKPTRKRVRVRGRPKNKYSSSTAAPRTSSSVSSDEHTEFYGFLRQPNFSQSSQINSHTDEEENIHLYAPIQQKPSPVFEQRQYEPIATSSPRADPETPVRFLGELRPKYASPSRGTTTTQAPETHSTARARTRGRVRVPGRTYESRTSQENQSTERTTKVRTRGRTHFSPPRNTRQEESNETENYPIAYLRSKETGTTPSGSEFKITIDGDETNDQVPHSTINRAEKFQDLKVPTSTAPPSTTFNNKEERNSIGKEDEVYPIKNADVMSFRDERMKQEGFKIVDVDNFDTAESQDYRSFMNSAGAPDKVNELKSREIEEKIPPAMSSFEKIFLGMPSSEQQSSKSSTEESKLAKDVAGTNVSTIATTMSESETAVSTTSQQDSAEGGEITTTLAAEEELRMGTSTEEPRAPAQSAMDLLALQTSTSTEISQETEICYKGRCIKSRNKKLRRPVS